MMKSKPYIKIAAGVCFVLILTASAFILYQESIFNEKDFPLEVDLDKTVFNVGEKISITATITNKFGKDVNMSSNGKMPCVYFHNVNDTTAHGEITVKVDQIFKANEKISRVFEYEAVEKGTYILDAHYRIVVDNVVIENKIDDVIIEVR